MVGGEDFELLLTTPPDNVAQLQGAIELPLTVIGEVMEGGEVTVLDERGEPLELSRGGWDHFA